MKCYICDRVLHAKGYEMDHFPLPQECGGTKTHPCCLSCHNEKDRLGMESLDAAFVIGALAGLWEKATVEERLVLARMVSRYAVASKHIQEYRAKIQDG